MTDETIALLEELRNKCSDMLEEILDIAKGIADPGKGKSFWPIKDGDCPNVNDAYKTLYDLSDAELELSFYNETGNKFTNELSVLFMNCWVGGDDIGTFARKPLKEMINNEYQIYVDENTTHYKPARLLKRLLDAFEEAV